MRSCPFSFATLVGVLLCAATSRPARSMRRRRRFPRMDRRSTKLRRLAEMLLRVRRGLELLPRRASPSCRASHLVLSPAVLSRLLLIGCERQM